MNQAERRSLPPRRPALRSRSLPRSLLAATAVAIALLPVVADAATIDVWGWGSNSQGEIGNGSTKNATVPTLVSIPAGITITAVAAGSFHSLGLDSSGNAWAWGFNGDGELGNGTTTSSLVPVRVTMPQNVQFTAIACGGGHSVALDTGGHAWAWGFNGDGELGNGTTTSSLVPVPVTMPPSVTFTAIAAAGDGKQLGGEPGQTLAIDSTGHAWGWGYNADGQLGNGTTANSETPLPVAFPSAVRVTAISTNGDHSLAVDGSGDGWAWGHNVYGQLGNGTTKGSKMPVQVTMPPGVTFRSVTTGVFHSMGLDTQGNAWSWGSNGHGQLGDGGSSSANRTTPGPVGLPSGLKVISLGAGADFSVALGSTGQAWAWGYNGDGELGDATTVSTTSPVQVTMPPGVRFGVITADGTDSDHSLAIDASQVAAAVVPEAPTLFGLVLAGVGAGGLTRRLRWRGISARRRAGPAGS